MRKLIYMLIYNQVYIKPKNIADIISKYRHKVENC